MKTKQFKIGVAMLVLSTIGCIFTQRQAIEMTSPIPQREYTLVGETCDNANCLFVNEGEPDYPIGVATVTGYYAQIERSAFEQTKQCDSFIITQGPSVLIQSILSLIKHGNTVYTQNDRGQPVISFDLTNLMQSEKQRLISSSASEPVPVVLLATSPNHQDAPVCYSRFDILRVE
jgi:hypothetical protein